MKPSPTDSRHGMAEALIFPLFYFSGNRKQESDRAFISSRLDSLNKENRLSACVVYEELYKRHLNKGEGREARLRANAFLTDAAQQCGITSLEYREAQVKTLGRARHKFTDEIERIKALKPKVSILGMADNGKLQSR
ncbi:hypothetical protein NVP1166O_33 [Vibrio phage 1.166.O._10N.261.51.C7]|nr:hypothetical protein NVP1166O_33 [Vibrio phage 1.166.O._10N.261.51.C7]